MTIEEIHISIAEHAKEIGSLKHRMDDVEKITDCVYQLAQEMVGLTKEMKFMNATIETLTAKVGKLEERPANRWEQIVTALISVGIGALIGNIF
ncbi:MAG TPA: hypothetical protein H9763_01525 [Candidatus Eisenbergiella merdigallinarum]|uniref:Hemolysin XhlA n=1 Tax=Candidatus Eisenbergiella merdigallinarum TaxID=2838552 RepID=A0A9D2SBP4_9FIRM|nr:hypothetical protein [Candidatus Eisenbergiella merdigallinarum]